MSIDTVDRYYLVSVTKTAQLVYNNTSVLSSDSPVHFTAIDHEIINYFSFNSRDSHRI